MKTLKSMLMTIAVLLCSTTVSAYDIEVEGVYYTIIKSSKVARVSFENMEKTENSVIILDSVSYNGEIYPVTEIEMSAFNGRTNLENITIPQTVTFIDESAFAGCTSLPTENNVIYAGNWAVGVIDKTLVKYTLRENTVGLAGTFSGCSNLVKCSLPDSLKYIDSYSFWSCSALKSLEIPYGLKRIGKMAFQECGNLTTLDIPNTVTEIGWYSFNQCSNLSNITIPNSVTTIGEWAFAECHSLSEIVIPNSVTNLGNFAFYNCFSLEKVVLSNSMTEIKSGTFQSGSKLTDIVIPNSIESIANDAFIANWGSSILRVVIQSPTIISKGAFSNQFGTEVYEYILDANVTELPDFAFYNNTNLRTVILPETLTTIGEGAFEECVSLDSITIPTNVTEIKDGAFSNCTALRYIACEALVPPTCGTYTFDNVDTENCILEVPASAVNAYATTAPWSDFNIKVSLVDGEDYENETDTEAGVITYTRALNNLLWNALYIPIEIPVSQLIENYDIAYINAMHSYDMDDNGAIDKMEMEVVKIKEGTLLANYPYLIRAKNEEAKAMEIVVENSTLYAAESVTVDCSSVFTKFEITGTYQPLTNEEIDGCYALSGGAWKTMKDDATLNPFRLYLRISDREGSPVKIDTYALEQTSVTIRVQGENPGTTSIESEEIRVKNGESDATIYNMMGQPVKNPVKGSIYIQGGRKVVW